MTFTVNGKEIDARNNVVFELSRILEPFRVTMKWNDLLITFRILVSMDKGTAVSIPVTDGVLEEMGCTVEELYRMAQENTKRIFPPFIGDMVMFKVLTNTEGLKGAGVILYDDIMDTIRQEVEGDFYLIPSSIHEWLIIPDDGDVDEAGLGEMIREVNRDTVAPEDRLSDHPYRYKDGKVIEVMA